MLLMCCAVGALVAQCVSSGPRLIPAQGEIFSTISGGSIAFSLSLSTSHCPDMTEILLKRT